jgi:N-carbamoylputrescine amidase
MTRTMSVAAVQSALTDDPAANVRRMTEMVRSAAERGAQVILMPELFEGHYFPRAQREEHFDRAAPIDASTTITHFRAVARELGVVLPVSFYERSGPHYYNSVAVVDADGEVLGVYRKAHLPDGPGYMEKYHFRPGNTGFKAWKTRFGTIGVGICWDQWFPEAARAMALLGAEVLFYPTAIGSEPSNPNQDTRDRWQRVMIGHAVANVVGVVAANRVGLEGDITFYGSSFIADQRGDKVSELDRGAEDVIVASFDLDFLARERAAFGFFRDRRTDLYDPLME